MAVVRTIDDDDEEDVQPRRLVRVAPPPQEEHPTEEEEPKRLTPAGADDDRTQPFGETSRLPTLTRADQRRLPTISPGAPAGSSGFYRNQVAQLEDEKAHPWGTEGSAHPGRLGKIGHVLGTIGETALRVVNPAVAASIPGTRLNRDIREREAEENLQGAEKTEEAGRHNVAEEDILRGRTAATAEKNKGELSTKLRKLGLRVNDEGATENIPYEELTPGEQAKIDLQQTQGDAAEARALLDHMKANPNSPQNEAIKERLRIMAKNAATAAGKLGLDQKKFIADYLGLDEKGEPLPGVQTTDEGKAVGPKVAGANQKTLSEFNKNYVKPAEDVEKSFQMMNDAYNEYQAARAKGQELPTGAQSMLALSTHLSTTFGNVKGSRVTKDMIEHHLGARGISDAAVVAVQRLTNGDVLSPAQWDAFHDLIGKSRELSWKTAVKEGKRANQKIDFLPEDLKGLAGEPKKQPGGKTEGGAAAPGGGFAQWKAKKNG